MIKLFVLSFCVFFLLGQEVSLSSYVDSKTVEDNKLFKVYLEFSWQGEATDYKIQIAGLPIVYGLEVLGSGSSNKVGGTLEKPIITRKYFYNLKATRLGNASIEPISATATHLASSTVSNLSSQAIALTVIKGEEAFELDSKIIVMIIALVLIIVALIFLVLNRAKKKKDSLANFVTDDSLIEYKNLKQLTILKNDPDRVAETSKTFFTLYESYLEEAHINKHSILIDESSLPEFDFAGYKSRLDEIRFSGQNPDIYELEQLIATLKDILTANLETRKKRSSAQ